VKRHVSARLLISKPGVRKDSYRAVSLALLMTFFPWPFNFHALEPSLGLLRVLNHLDHQYHAVLVASLWMTPTNDGYVPVILRLPLMVIHGQVEPILSHGRSSQTYRRP
jgi:hypothetical protein